MADKDFKTIDEQIEILRSRGLTIEDEAEAKDFLLRNNYYRVSGYSLTLRKNDVFAKSATFQNIEDIYNFDHEFRHIILHHIETIEVQMKSIYCRQQFLSEELPSPVHFYSAEQNSGHPAGPDAAKGH